MRRLLAALLLPCACTAAAPPERASPPAAIEPLDPRLAWLEIFDEAGLPSTLGWQRVEQVVALSRDGRRSCRRGWVRPQGAHRILVTDELDIDYGGSWLAQWPEHMRVAADAYDDVVLPTAGSNGRLDMRTEMLAERPSDLLAEVTATLAGNDGCGEGSPDSVSIALARASWVRERGHDALALAMVRRWPAIWNEAWVRDRLAGTLLWTALQGLRQGLPRTLARAMLERARAIGRGDPRQHAEQLLALLGEDPTASATADDADALLAWLPDDLMYPARSYVPQRGREQLGWPDPRAPRSPALELVALGWQALPAMIEGNPPERLMRTSGFGLDYDGKLSVSTTRSAIRRTASMIALVPFADDAAMRRWWAIARERGELAMMVDNLARPDAYLRRSVVRILELDPSGGPARIEGVWSTLGDERRGEIMEAIVGELGPGIERPHVDATTLPGLGALVRRATRSDALEVLAPAADAAQRLGERAWLAHATTRARAALARVGPQDEEGFTLAELLATIARADVQRGTRLLRTAQRSGRAGALEVTEIVLELLCDAWEDEPTPDCHPPLRRMFDARARVRD